MPRNGSGSFTLPQPPFVPNTTISSTAVNADFSDVATALTQSVAADGQTPITGSLQGASAGSATAPSYAFSGNLNSGVYPAGSGNVGVAVNGVNVATFTPTGILGFGGTPIGTVINFAGAAAPAGWVFCNGQVLSTTTFAALFAVIGYTFGGAGANFNVPNTANRFVLNSGLATAGGSFTTGIAQGNLPSVAFNGSASVSGANHSHNVSGGVVGGNSSAGVLSGGSFSAPIGASNIGIGNSGVLSMSGSASVNSGGSNIPLTTTPPFIRLNSIIFAAA